MSQSQANNNRRVVRANSLDVPVRTRFNTRSGSRAISVDAIRENTIRIQLESNIIRNQPFVRLVREPVASIVELSDTEDEVPSPCENSSAASENRVPLSSLIEKNANNIVPPPPTNRNNASELGVTSIAKNASAIVPSLSPIENNASDPEVTTIANNGCDVVQQFSTIENIASELGVTTIANNVSDIVPPPLPIENNEITEVTSIANNVNDIKIISIDENSQQIELTPIEDTSENLSPSIVEQVSQQNENYLNSRRPVFIVEHIAEDVINSCSHQAISSDNESISGSQRSSSSLFDSQESLQSGDFSIGSASTSSTQELIPRIVYDDHKFVSLARKEGKSQLLYANGHLYVCRYKSKIPGGHSTYFCRSRKYGCEAKVRIEDGNVCVDYGNYPHSHTAPVELYCNLVVAERMRADVTSDILDQPNLRTIYDKRALE